MLPCLKRSTTKRINAYDQNHDNIATRRALQGRKPNGAPLASPAKLEELTRTAQYLANLPEHARAAAAMRMWPPSGLREALYRHAKGDTIAEVCAKTAISPVSFEMYLRAEDASPRTAPSHERRARKRVRPERLPIPS
jgi:hypothetical protein